MGSHPDMAELDNPDTLDGGAAEAIPATGRRLLAELEVEPWQSMSLQRKARLWTRPAWKPHSESGKLRPYSANGNEHDPNLEGNLWATEHD